MGRRLQGGLLAASVCFLCTQPALGQSREIIVFASDRDGQREIYSMLADGSHQTNLTRSPGRDQSPALSPDGSTVAFTSDRSGALGIWLMDVDGARARMVREIAEADFGLAWSPDGRSLALTLQRPGGGGHDIAVLSLESGALTALTDTRGVEEITPAWAPAGGHLYFILDAPGGSSLVAMDLADRSTDVLIDAGMGSAAFPSVSPDGANVLFRSRQGEHFDVLTADLGSGRIERLVDHPANDWGAVWSRNGRLVTFASDRDGDLEIYSWDRSTGQLTQLTDNDNRDWMPSR